MRFSIVDAEKDTDELGYCHYAIYVYPTADFEKEFKDNYPLILTLISSTVFLAIAIAFFMYDSFVQRRNSKIVTAAAESNAVVLSLFPAHIRDQILNNNRRESSSSTRSNRRLKGFLDANSTDESRRAMEPLDTKPIADLFLETTVMFADVSAPSTCLLQDTSLSWLEYCCFVGKYSLDYCVFSHNSPDFWVYSMEFCSRAKSSLHAS